MRKRGGDARGNPSFRKRKGSPGPPPKETILGRIRRPKGAAGAALLHLRKSVSVPARPLRAGTGNLKRLSWGRAREGAFFLLKEGPLSQRKTGFFRRPPLGGRGGRLRLLLHLRKSISVPTRSPRAGTGNLKRLSWGRAREGAFFLLKEGPLSQRKTAFFRRPPLGGRGVGCGLAAFKEKRIRPGAPSARRDRKPEAAFLGESARGPSFF